MSATMVDGRMSEAEYLRREQVSGIRHELINGQALAMAGASRNHERITGNLYASLLNHLRGSRCEPFASNVKVKAGGQFFYPDVMVVCDDRDGPEYYTQAPGIIVEVLSPSTRRMDETIKRMVYQSLPSLMEYVLIEQDFVDVEVCSRSEGWVSRHYFMGDAVTLDSIGLTLTVESIYERVVNDDVRTYRVERQPAADSAEMAGST